MLQGQIRHLNFRCDFSGSLLFTKDARDCGSGNSLLIKLAIVSLTVTEFSSYERSLIAVLVCWPCIESGKEIEWQGGDEQLGQEYIMSPLTYYITKFTTVVALFMRKNKNKSLQHLGIPRWMNSNVTNWLWAQQEMS